MLSSYNGFSRAISLVSSMITIAIAKKLRTKTAFRFSYTVSAIVYLLKPLWQKTGRWLWLRLRKALFAGISASAKGILFAEASEYTRWENGDNVTAAAFSAMQSTHKVGAYIANFAV